MYKYALTMHIGQAAYTQRPCVRILPLSDLARLGSNAIILTETSPAERCLNHWALPAAEEIVLHEPPLSVDIILIRK
jgi:hypothetical protein